MAKKEYKSGTREYYISKEGYKRDRKEYDRINSEYKKLNYKSVTIRIRKEDFEILQKLNSVKSKNNYILELIRADIKASED